MKSMLARITRSAINSRAVFFIRLESFHFVVGGSLALILALLGVEGVGNGEHQSAGVGIRVFDLAAKLLGEFIENPRKKRGVVTFGSVGIVRRASTRRFARRDEPVRKAVEMIRTEACGGLSARDVVKAIGGSRRNAEMRFRALAGKSIGEAIQETGLSPDNPALAAATDKKIYAVSFAKILAGIGLVLALGGFCGLQFGNGVALGMMAAAFVLLVVIGKRRSGNKTRG